MDRKSCFVDNGAVRIHYLDSNASSSSSQVPLLICPGLSETAEEYIDLMEYLYPRRCIILSFRGRGLSSTPNEGYDLKHHVSDIEAVVHDAGLNRFHLYSYSRGVSYGLGYAEKRPSSVFSLIIQDYPAMHKEMSSNWAEDYILNYLVIFNRQRIIRPEAVRGIQRESIQKDFTFKSNKKWLVIRGLLEGSLLDNDGIKQYKLMNPNVIIKSFEHSGHDIRNTEKDLLYQTINSFLMS
jgi:pimeloyl-ACP methyl ester carboxylesterase